MRSGRSLLWTAFTGVMLFTGSLQLQCGTPPAQASGAAVNTQGVEPTAEELRFVALANQERASRNLGQLTIDPLLIVVARQHSREMMEKDYFDHYSPTPGQRTPMERYLKALGSRPRYACVGENLFYCSIVDIPRGHQAFMKSPKHRENVLYGRYERIGVGIQKNDRGEFWVTQMFLTNSSP